MAPRILASDLPCFFHQRRQQRGEGQRAGAGLNEKRRAFEIDPIQGLSEIVDTGDGQAAFSYIIGFGLIGIDTGQRRAVEHQVDGVLATRQVGAQGRVESGWRSAGDFLSDIPTGGDIAQRSRAAHVGGKTGQAVDLRQSGNILLPVHGLQVDVFVGFGDQSFLERRALKEFVDDLPPFLVRRGGELVESGSGQIRGLWV